MHREGSDTGAERHLLLRGYADTVTVGGVAEPGVASNDVIAVDVPAAQRHRTLGATVLQRHGGAVHGAVEHDRDAEDATGQRRRGRPPRWWPGVPRCCGDVGAAAAGDASAG